MGGTVIKSGESNSTSRFRGSKRKSVEN